MTGAEGKAGTGTHSLLCGKGLIIQKVNEHINLSTTERDRLFALGPHENPCCNCKVVLQGSKGDHKLGSELITDTISWVLSLRMGSHPSGGSGFGSGEDTGGVMMDDDDAGESCQVIRIDFGLRRRII